MHEIHENGIRLYPLPDCDSDEDEEYKEQVKQLKVGDFFLFTSQCSLLHLKLRVNHFLNMSCISRLANLRIRKTLQWRRKRTKTFKHTKNYLIIEYLMFIKVSQPLFCRDGVNRHSSLYSRSNNELCHKQTEMFMKFINAIVA